YAVAALRGALRDGRMRGQVEHEDVVDLRRLRRLVDQRDGLVVLLEREGAPAVGRDTARRAAAGDAARAAVDAAARGVHVDVADVAVVDVGDLAGVGVARGRVVVAAALGA